jgi:probable selenium-dependent hydroxylase accessory protein YqeC
MMLLDAFDAWNERVIALVGAGGKTTAMFHMAHEFGEAGRRVIVTTTTRIRMPDRGDVGLMIVSDDPSELLDRARIAVCDHQRDRRGVRFG